MKKFAIILSFMMFLCPACADIYKWVDSQGNVHFSDTPRLGAERLNIPEVQTFSPPAALPSIPQRLSPEIREQKRSYSRIAIVAPDNEATIRNNDGSVDVVVEIEPALLQGDLIQLIFDDAPLGEPQTNLLFQLSGIYRGSHTIAVQIIDPDEHVIARSDTITLFMFRPRVGMGATGK